MAILVWVVASALFAFYVANFGSYNKTYGALTGLVIFLVWFWRTNLALLFGIELDAEMSGPRNPSKVCRARTGRSSLTPGRPPSRSEQPSGA